MRKGTWTEKNEKDDAGYFLKVSKLLQIYQLFSSIDFWGKVS